MNLVQQLFRNAIGGRLANPMKRYAILGDIHANLEALEAVLEDSRRMGCTHYACLGDIVGYNANPRECLQTVQNMGMPTVKGNHDEYCATETPVPGLNLQAAKMVTWTRQQLSRAERRWLLELPLIRESDGFLIVHASLDSSHLWPYVFDRFAAAASFLHQRASVCFFGHTHVPLAFVQDRTLRGGTFSQFRVEAGSQYFVNAGSVGQPRDGDPRAAYVIYDLSTATIELRRVDYDIDAARESIRRAGLPERLGE